MTRSPAKGPTTAVSVPFHIGAISAVRSRVGKRGVSAYIEAAVHRQIERDNLDEIIAAAEAEHGPVTAEEIHPRIDRPAIEWVVSRLTVEPITTDIARRAATLLQQAGRHDHRHAVDAILAATALSTRGPTTILTSDPDDLATLSAVARSRSSRCDVPHDAKIQHSRDPTAAALLVVRTVASRVLTGLAPVPEVDQMATVGRQPVMRYI
jgi:predicted nucleic acid-binding protein